MWIAFFLEFLGNNGNIIAGWRWRMHEISLSQMCRDELDSKSNVKRRERKRCVPLYDITYLFI